MGEDASCLGGGKKGNRFIYVTKGRGDHLFHGQRAVTDDTKLEVVV